MRPILIEGSARMGMTIGAGLALVLSGLANIAWAIVAGRSQARATRIPRLTAWWEPSLTLEEWKETQRRGARIMVWIGAIVAASGAIGVILRVLE